MIYLGWFSFSLIFHQAEKFTFPELVEQTIQQLEGAFALVLKSKHFPNECVVTRRGSPMLIGVKSDKPMNVDQIQVINHPCTTDLVRRGFLKMQENLGGLCSHFFRRYLISGKFYKKSCKKSCIFTYQIFSQFFFLSSQPLGGQKKWLNKNP